MYTHICVYDCHYNCVYLYILQNMQERTRNPGLLLRNLNYHDRVYTKYKFASVW